MSTHLNRRTFLRGLVAGAAVSVALPPLEAMMNANGTAYAAGGAFPCRFGLYFWGNGILPDRWVPTDTGPDYTLSPQLAPLEGVRDHVAVLSGYTLKVANVVAHGSGVAGILSGRDMIQQGEDATFAGPSLDQVIAGAIGDATRFRSLEVGVQPGMTGRSHTGPWSVNPPESDPVALFERLFGPSFRQPGDGSVVDPRIALKRSLLDGVLADAQTLNTKLGAADRARLEQHLDAVRDLELRLARLQEDPPDLDACVRPEAPEPIPPIEGRPQMLARARVMADLTTMALACDQTRVASMWFTDPLNDVLFPDATAGHHQLTHDEPGDQPQVHDIILATMEGFAYWLESMRDITEGDGTLLDHCAVLATSDVSYGRTHSIDEYPILVAGGADGRLKTGFHHRTGGGENAGRVPLTLLRALGVSAASFGEGNAQTDRTVSELEA